VAKQIQQAKSSAVTGPRDSLWPNYSPPVDLIFSHGRGSELVTDEGDTYLDFLSGIAVTSFGHAHPHLVDVLNKQSQQLWHVSNLFRIPAAERLATRLTENCFAERAFFANSGTEAIEAGIKAIRGYQASIGATQRYRIIGFSDSFHGRTLAALAAAGNASHSRGFIPTDYGFDQVKWGDLDALQQAIGEHTAGIVLEPVQGEGGIRPVKQEFLEQVRALCDEHGLVLMYDEIQCGIGRSGKMFAHQHYGVAPDVMALAKGLGGGFPVGACLTSAAVGDAMVVGTHGSTFGGNPLAMAVGNGVMDLLLEPGLLEEVTAKGAYLQQALADLVQAYPEQLSSVQGLGLMIGLVCKMPNTELMTRLRDNKLLVVTAGNNMIRLLPPLNISSQHLDQGLAIIESVLQQIQAEAN
jgi:acetylornithine/N-succinyldiaminopimelate aminotransferase